MSEPVPEPRFRPQDGSKLMFALWGDRIRHALLEPELRERLAATGVRRLQLNLDDEDVSRAQLRLQSFDAPVRAVVSVWTAGPEPGVDAWVGSEVGAEVATEVAAVLAEVAPRLAGWRVDERRPLEPPATPDGARADALANVAFLRRPDALPREEWLHRWLDEHTPVAIETQATFGYVQNVVVEAVTAGAPRVDALVEELFPMAALDDLHAFYGSGGDQHELDRRLTRMLESVARFGADRDLDVVPTSRYVFDLA